MIENFSKQGVAYATKDDVILYRWPWSRKGKDAFNSLLVGDFNKISQYWFLRGRGAYNLSESERVEGFLLHDILLEWSRRKYPGEWLVILYDINPESRINEFWSKLPPGFGKVFSSNDVCVLKCGSKKKGLELSNAMPDDLGVSLLVIDGITYDSNSWKD